MAKVFEQLGYALAPQAQAELLIKNWAKRDFQPVFNFVKYNGQAFQDLPFSLPETYKHLYDAFPNSKFILTIRSSADEWYNSLVRFHSAKFGKGGQVPTKDDLMRATYRYPGFAWEVNRCLHNTPEDDPYEKNALMSSYNVYNQEVVSFFKERDTSRLLVVNLADKDALSDILSFLGRERELHSLPWENKS